MQILQEAYRYLSAGQIQRARALFEQVLSHPDFEADALNGLGLCAEAQAQVRQAEAYYRQALALRPAEPEFLNNLGLCLQQQGHYHAAIEHFENLLLILNQNQQSQSEIEYNLAYLYYLSQQAIQALEHLARVLSLAPGPQVLALLLAIIKGSLHQAGFLESLQTLRAQYPDLSLYQIALANYYDLKDQPDLAQRHLRAALQAQPELLGAYRQWIQNLQEQGKHAQSLTLMRRLFQDLLDPANLAEMLIALQVSIPLSESQMQTRRQEMLALLDGFLTRPHPRAIGQLKLASIPFFMSYQTDDDKDLQIKLAEFYRPFFQVYSEIPKPNLRSRPRLAMVSTHFYQHSVMDLLIRALQPLLADQSFESWLLLCPISQYSKRDTVSEYLKQASDHVVELSEDIFVALNQMAGLELDILVFPDIGMDAYTYVLGMNRLARYQLALPGHPLTTGLTTIDYFMSSQALEQPDADARYTEHLIRLPGMPDYQAPVWPGPAEREALGLPEGNLYFSPMTAFKYLPAFDQIMAAILQQDPQGQILLLEFKDQLHLTIQARFQRAYPELAGRLHFLPWSNQQVFFQRLQACDVIMDTFPFGGGNTSYQALGLGCAIVALDVPAMKGRWTQALYQMLGLSECVCANPQDYIAMALKIAQDKVYQAELRAKIKIQSQVLFGNPTWSDGLRDFCIQLT